LRFSFFIADNGGSKKIMVGCVDLFLKNGEAMIFFSPDFCQQTFLLRVIAAQKRAAIMIWKNCGT